MSVLLDIALAIVIAGIVIAMLLNIQMGMLESNIENRMTQSLQGLANATVDLIQEDIKRLVSFDELTDSTIKFVNTDNEVVTIERSGRSIRILREFPDGSDPVERRENVFLQSLQFTPVNLPNAANALLRIRVATEMNNEDTQLDNTVRAFAQRDVLLRNLYFVQQD